MFGAVLVVVGACSGASPGTDPADASQAPTDGPTDSVQVGSWTTDVDCSSTLDALYGMPMGSGPRGSIVGCTVRRELDQATAQTEFSEDGAEGVVAQTGVTLVTIAYRTVRSDGTPSMSTATVYLPKVPRSVPAPVVLIGRSTSGLADTCAPTRDDLPQRNYALPLAARGFVTVTPDYAGLGTAGTHAYLDNHEAATQLFDSAKAVQALVQGNVVGEPVAAIGYSQGGGIVLSAQGLEYELTGKRTLKAVAAIAPEWPMSAKSFGYEDILRNTDRLTALAGLSPPTVLVLRHYGFMMNKIGAAQATAAFPEDERLAISSQIDSLCTVPLGGALNGNQPWLRDLVDPTFRAQVLACIDGQAGCTGHGAAFYQWMESDYVTADPAGARVLITQGLADQVMPASGEAACNVAKLRAEGVQPDICADTTGTHDSILEKRVENTIAWLESVVAGTPQAPGCGATQLPACNR